MMTNERQRAEFEAWAARIGLCVTGKYAETINGLCAESAFKAGYKAALQSQATEAFPCRIVEADFETGTVTLEMQGDYTVSSGQKYLCDAPLQTQDAEDAERFRFCLKHGFPQKWEEMIRGSLRYYWTSRPGSQEEFSSAIEAIDHARRVEEK